MMRTWAEISLRQLRENLAALDRGVIVCPVVKANAYGHGAVPISQALENAGVTWLAVSCVSEAAALRDAGISTRILVMGGLLPFEREAVFRYSLTPVVHSLEELAEWDRQPVSVHLKIDTGMSRLGATASPAEIVSALRALKNATVEGLMSHFASAEDSTTDQTAQQTASFEAVLHAVREAGISIALAHMSSTNGIVFRNARYSLIRPGLGIYGYASGKPILTWYARLLKIREISAGTPVGYLARFHAPRAMRIGTVAAGYADGIPHRLSTRGSLVSQGRLLPILGAVSMDLTTIDLTAAPNLQPGDPVTVLGPGMNAQQIADIAGEISYSVLCGIGNRVTRVYTDI